MSGFNAGQIAQLLKPIAPQRVLEDGKGHSHVSQQDVTAHLVRMFGFGGFDTEILSLNCVFANERVKDGKPSGRWDVCYSATLRLIVKDEHGQEVAHYEDGSTATAQNQTLGDAHDLAMKSAISLAKKRCAINLGDQFGLSLYNKGQKKALVLATLVGADETHETPEDVQADVPQQVTLGNDETDYEPGDGPASEDAEFAAADAQRFEQLIDGATTAIELTGIGEDLAKSTTVTGASREALRRRYSAKAKTIMAAAS